MNLSLISRPLIDTDLERCDLAGRPNALQFSQDLFFAKMQLLHNSTVGHMDLQCAARNIAGARQLR